MNFNNSFSKIRYFFILLFILLTISQGIKIDNFTNEISGFVQNVRGDSLESDNIIQTQDQYILNNENYKTSIIDACYNFTFFEDTYTWYDAYNNGEERGLYGSGSYATINFNKFDFPFYDIIETNVYINVNGWLSFDSSTTDPTNPDFPVLYYEYVVAPFWYDLLADYNIYYWETDNFLAIEFHNYTYSDGSPLGTFEVVFFKSGDILIQYQDIVFDRGATKGLNHGIDLDYFSILSQNLTGVSNLAIRYKRNFHNLMVDVSSIETITSYENITIDSTIYNLGTFTETNCDFKLLIDNKIVFSDIISDIEAETNISYYYSWNTEIIGDHNITVYIALVEYETNLVDNIITIWTKCIGNARNYEVMETSYYWYDAAENGYAINMVNGPNGFSNVSIPFSFNYYGILFDSVFVSANGWISFVNHSFDWIVWLSAPDYTPNDLYTYTITPFGEDNLVTSSTDIYCWNTSDFVVFEYNNIFNEYNLSVGTFEVVLFNNGQILFQYKQINEYHQSNTEVGLNHGIDLRFYTECTNYLRTGLALLFDYPNNFEKDLVVIQEVPNSNLFGESVQINSTVINCGDSDEIDIELKLWIDEELVSSQNYPNLRSGYEYTDHFIWNPSVIGTYNITTLIVPSEDENNTINNRFSQWVTIYTLNEESDLSVRLDVTRVQVISESVTINGQLYNLGNNSEVDIELQLWINNELITSEIYNEIQNGTSKLFSYEWFPLFDGDYNVSLYIVPTANELLYSDLLENNLVNRWVTIYEIGEIRNYAISEISYSWYDAATNGYSLGISGEHSYGRIKLPFEFYFYGSFFDVVYVGSNGWLSFVEDEPSGDVAGDFPNDYHRYVISPFWHELESANNIFCWKTTEFVVIEYNNFIYWDGNSLGTFEVILFRNGNILFQYKEIFEDRGATIGTNYGSDPVYGSVINYYTLYSENIAGIEEFALFFEIEEISGHDLFARTNIPETILFGEELEIDITIRNLGNYIENDINLQLWIDNAMVTSYIYEELLIGSINSFSFNWIPSTLKEYNITVYLIPSVEETYIANNLDIKFVVVTDPIMIFEIGDYINLYDEDGYWINITYLNYVDSSHVNISLITYDLVDFSIDEFCLIVNILNREISDFKSDRSTKYYYSTHYEYHIETDLTIGDKINWFNTGALRGTVVGIVNYEYDGVLREAFRVEATDFTMTIFMYFDCTTGIVVLNNATEEFYLDIHNEAVLFDTNMLNDEEPITTSIPSPSSTSPISSSSSSSSSSGSQSSDTGSSSAISQPTSGFEFLYGFFGLLLFFIRKRKK